MRSFVLILLLAGCGLRAPDYVSAAGVEYRFEGRAWDSAQIEAQEQGFLRALPPGYERAQDAMREVRVFVYPDKFHCVSSPTGWCNGVQDYQDLSLRALDCPGKSALTHEIAHFLEQYVKGITDYDHVVEPELWKAADVLYPGGC